jgi:hypothetical protein
MTTRRFVSSLAAGAVMLVAAHGAVLRGQTAAAPGFDSPEAAVRALIDAAQQDAIGPIVALFGAEGANLVDTTDPAAARRNRATFVAAAAERWQLEEDGAQRRLLIVGNERWPFPVPLVQTEGRWRFDAAAGREEVIARRIGRNELTAIRVSRLYVAAQRLYAKTGHDGQPPGAYARRLHSDPGTQNGLYWKAARGETRSPIGDLLAGAARDGKAGPEAGAPFHGYYFRILTAQGAAAAGGAADYVRDGRLTGGFALVAWPAMYDVTGIMTFVVNQDGVVQEKDLGPDTDAIVDRMRAYDPGEGWSEVP